MYYLLHTVNSHVEGASISSAVVTAIWPLGLQCLRFPRWVGYVSCAILLSLGTTVPHSNENDVSTIVNEGRASVFQNPSTLFLSLRRSVAFLATMPQGSHQDPEKNSPERSRASSWTACTTDRPDLHRRDSLASLSVARDPTPSQEEQKWPKGWRPYTCLLGGFFLMFNSWGLVRSHIAHH